VLNISVFLCIVALFTSILMGLVLLMGYTLIKDYKKEVENLTYSHSKIKELEDIITQTTQKSSNNNSSSSISNQKYDLLAPKIILDNKIYSQQEFSKETNNGKFQMNPMLQSKLYKKNR